uniref:Flavin reductase n=1 Tax=Roseihalotalea indica TaxID=2867963 RepID=A0AA49GPI2_9BACT|nr:flavin reductase [Tunicatimonas sp. TK19036]
MSEAHTFNRQSIDQLEKRYRTNLINSLTGFKSVALIGTHNAAGKTNLAVFSQIIHVGANPPLIGVLFRPHSVPRHTLENILETKTFTINHIAEAFMAQAHHTSARWEDSEFEACALTPEYRDSIPAPFVKESKVKVGLRYVEHQTLVCNETIFLVGEIQEIVLPAKSVVQDGFIDLIKAGTLTCSGLDAYHQVYPPTRLEYAKPDQPVIRKDP